MSNGAEGSSPPGPDPSADRRDSLARLADAVETARAALGRLAAHRDELQQRVRELEKELRRAHHNLESLQDKRRQDEAMRQRLERLEEERETVRERLRNLRARLDEHRDDEAETHD